MNRFNLEPAIIGLRWGIRRWIISLGILISGSVVLGSAALACTLDQATGTTIDAKPFIMGGYCTRWNFATNRLVFMQPGADGYYRVFTMNPDGTDRRAVTEHCPGLPTRHQGTAYWHPSGRYILLIAQKQAYSSRKMFGNPDYDALPGFGLHDDLWLITADGSKCWRLTNEPDGRDEGELIPVFSPDGKKVAWSSRQPGGNYILKVADFAEMPEPHLENARSYQSGGKAYYETGSFSSDSRSLAYTSNQDTHSFWLSQIYRLDLATGKSARLTLDKWTYNEHPIVVNTPSGDWVIYMSTKNLHRSAGHVLLGTDWWAMRIDGSDAKRLTWMNTPGNVEDTGAMQVAGTCAISPNGDYFLGDVQDSLTKQTGYVRVVRFVGK